MIRCEHCGSPLLDGAIFCGECGRAVSTTGTRRAPAPASDHGTPPPPLQAPARGGAAADQNRPDPAADAWLPEATLDPATRAWLTGDDRGGPRPADAPAIPVETPGENRPRSAPTHVHGAGTGLGDWTGGVSREPSLDPSAFDPVPGDGDVDDAEATRVADRARRDEPLTPLAESAPPEPAAWHAPEPAAWSAPEPAAWSAPEPAAWSAPAAVPPESAAAQARPRIPAPPAQPQEPAAPAAPSWWIDRSGAAPAASTSGPTASGAGQGDAVQPDAVQTDAERTDAERTDAEQPDAAARGASPSDALPSDTVRDDDAQPTSDAQAPVDGDAATDVPRPGDTAVVPGIAERRTYSAPAPLVAPGSQPTSCHVCGHTLEPDDIFCEECGAVRPAVTAAFTGPVMPLPLIRPDWSVEEGDVVDVVDVADRDDADVTPPRVDAEPTELGDAPTSAEPTELGAAPTSAAPTSAAPTDPGDAPVDARADVGDGAQGADRAFAHHLPAHVSAPDPERASDPGRTGDPTPLDRVPGSATMPSSAPSIEPVPGAPFVPPLPPVPTSEDGNAGLDAWARARGLGDPIRSTRDDDPLPTSADGDDDVDATRIVSRTPERAPLILHFSTGERVGVQGSGLIGRLPRPEPGERFDEMVSVVDPGKSVSKTHLEIGREGDDLWVSDRFSGNGTVVRHIDGSIRRCEPGRRYRVERGARVDIGEQFFLVQ